MSRIVVVGGGLGGLASAALLARAGHQVTLLEANDYLGGKSRRIAVGGQRIDTGPSLVTFPGVWEELLSRLDVLGASGGPPAQEVAGLRLRRLPEVGRYYYRDQVTSLPVPEGHPWHSAWRRFAGLHGGLGPEVTKLLTLDPLDRGTFPALWKLLRLYGTRLTTRSYLEKLAWMPEGLREVIAIHTLNAGVSPARTPALFASMPAVMASDGVWVPDGGVYEIVHSLERLARHAGAEIRTGEPVTRIEPGKVSTGERELPADAVVSGLDAPVLDGLLEGPGKNAASGKLSCSGIAVYAALKEELPEKAATHAVVLPSSPAALYGSLENLEEPEETMAFVNYYRPGEVYPNDRGTVALLLTAPANGESYDLDAAFVRRETDRVSEKIGLDGPLDAYFENYEMLDPRYFGGWGGMGGALYGAVRPLWRSGPFHSPGYTDRRRPWLYRVGASVHPGGGIPAVLGGAMISTSRLLKALE